MIQPTHIPVRITMESRRYEIAASLFDDIYGQLPGVSVALSSEQDMTAEDELLIGVLPDGEEDGHPRFFVKPADPSVLRKDENEEGGVEKMELITEGMLDIFPDSADGEGAATIAVSYEESELTGMEGSTSTITYRTDERELVTMLRSGAVKTAMTFRAHTRSICSYETPYMPFEICVHALVVDNRLDTDGTLYLDYIIEIRGGCAERCIMDIRIAAEE